MSLLRRLARMMLAATFVTGGLDQVRNPAPKAPADEDVDLIRVNGAVQLVAGLLLALGRIPRLAALALAGTLIPTTAAAHRFWDETDKLARQQQQVHFLKNVSMLGGLLLAAMDTEGRPGLAWRTRHAAEHAEAAVKRRRRDVRRAAKAARAKLPD